MMSLVLVCSIIIAWFAHSILRLNNVVGYFILFMILFVPFVITFAKPKKVSLAKIITLSVFAIIISVFPFIPGQDQEFPLFLILIIPVWITYLSIALIAS